MEKGKTEHYYYRFSPCPDYDITGTESWLEEMHARGLKLSRDGFFAGLVIFEKCIPKKVRYRLDVMPKETGILSENWKPEEDSLELTEHLGWEYVTTRGQFFIYRAEDENARELNTDPQVQNLALKKVQKRMRLDVFTCFFTTCVYPIIAIRGAWLLTEMNSNPFLFWLLMLLLIWLFVHSVRRVVYFQKLRKRLLTGKDSNHEIPLRKKKIRYWGMNIIRIVLMVTWVIVFINSYPKVIGDDGIPLSEYRGTVPFATMKDFAPEGKYKSDDLTAITNTVEIRSDILAPVIIKWRESASVKLPDGRVMEGGLYIDYYETKAPWLAREAAREYVHKDKREKHYTDYTEMMVPEIEADFVASYSAVFPVIVIQKGNVVIRAMFYQTSPNYELAYEEWVKVLAESIDGE